MSRKKNGLSEPDNLRQRQPVDRKRWFSVSGAGELPVLPITATAGRREERFDMHWVIGLGWIHLKFNHGCSGLLRRTTYNSERL
jgi:hypothetical protein